MIKREWEAIKRDVSRWNRSRKVDPYQVSGNLEELREYIESYPSIFRRIDDLRWSVVRRYDDLRDKPRKMRDFVHRGRHGWAPSDAWNVDTYLVDMLIPLLEYYKEHNMGHPMDETEEEHDQKIDRIIHGLRQYQLFEENWPDLPIEEFNAASASAMQHVADAFTLLGEELPGIWI